MPELLGYGEDALTYWALTKRLSPILTQLNDATPCSEVLIFFRPSFGRGGKGGKEFGEFDAIIGTRQAAYLIESKWDGPAGSNNATGTTITLDCRQVRRHDIFDWYFNHCKGRSPLEWLSIQNQYAAAFANRFKGKQIASKDDKVLAPNLVYVLDRLNRIGCRKVANVLLYLKRPSSPTPTMVVMNTSPTVAIAFPIVTIDYSTVPNGNYIDML